MRGLNVINMSYFRVKKQKRGQFDYLLSFSNYSLMLKNFGKTNWFFQKSVENFFFSFFNIFTFD